MNFVTSWFVDKQKQREVIWKAGRWTEKGWTAGQFTAAGGAQWWIKSETEGRKKDRIETEPVLVGRLCVLWARLGRLCSGLQVRSHWELQTGRMCNLPRCGGRGPEGPQSVMLAGCTFSARCVCPCSLLFTLLLCGATSRASVSWLFTASLFPGPLPVVGELSWAFTSVVWC